MHLWHKGLLLLSLLLVFSGLSFADVCPPAFDPTGGLMTLVPVCLMIVVVADALLYMLSKVANMPKTEAWVKVEVRELVITALIASLVVSAVVGGNTLADSLAGTSSCGYISVASNYLTDQRNDMNTLAVKMTEAAFRVGKITGWQYDISKGIGPISTFRSAAPKSGLNALNTAISGAMDSLSQAMFIVTTEKMLLEFFQVFFLFVFPIGIILRAVPLTRKLGAALIAVAIGTYLCYPATLIVAGQIFAEQKSSGSLISANEISIPDIGKPPGVSIICNKWMPLFTDIGEAGWIHVLCPPICAASFGILCPVCPFLVTVWYIYIHAMFSTMFAPKLKAYSDVPVEQLYTPLSQVALPAVAQRFILALILLLFIAISTVTLTKSFSEALGGEGQFYGLSRII